MARSTIPALRVGHMHGESEHGAKNMHPCRRCGRVREARKNAILCIDCKDVCSPEEKRAYAAEAARERSREVART